MPSIFLAVWILCFLVFPGDLLAAPADDPDDPFEEGFDSPSAPLPVPSGLTLMGLSGLVTIPTPGPTLKRRFQVGLKRAPTLKTTFSVGTETFRYDLVEEFRQVSLTLPNAMELSCTQFHNRRTTSPNFKTLDGDDTLTGFGLRLQDSAKTPSWALGIQFTPISNDQASRLDAEQIAQMRAAFVTGGGQMTKRIFGHAHFRACFPPSRDWVYPTGEVQHEEAKAMTIFGMGAECRLGRRNKQSLFGEILNVNYRGLVAENKTPWQAHVGLRFSMGPVNLEGLVRSVGQDPLFMTGLNLSY